jgi:hypothetical protein
METTENLVLQLTELLGGDRFYRKKFDYLWKEFKELENPGIMLIDFEYYNDDRLTILKKKKSESIEKQDFEAASVYRDLEAECQEYIDIKEEYNITESMFYYEKEYLFYFYFGTAKNDKKVKQYLKTIIGE